MLQKCKIIDTTLREGEQTPGILFALPEKKHIIDGLAEIGVQEIELGISSRLTTCLPELIQHCRTRWPNLQTSVWSRCKEEDIQHAASLQPDVISLSMPVSDIHLQNKLGKSREWAVSTLMTSVASARASGLRVSVGFEDGTRADLDFLLQMSQVAEKSGAFRIRIADTVGTASPGSMGVLMKKLATTLSRTELAAHTHNDFGMATANAIAALENGATWVDATILGLGERCGCARLEELAGYLHLIANNHSFRVANLKPLASYVATCSALHIPDNLPILGNKIFTCETGLHLQGLQRAPQTYEPYAPEKVGATRKLLFGAKTGKNALTTHMQQLGYDIAEEKLSGKLQTLRDMAISFQRPLTDTELRTVFSAS